MRNDDIENSPHRGKGTLSTRASKVSVFPGSFNPRAPLLHAEGLPSSTRGWSRWRAVGLALASSSDSVQCLAVPFSTTLDPWWWAAVVKLRPSPSKVTRMKHYTLVCIPTLGSSLCWHFWGVAMTYILLKRESIHPLNILKMIIAFDHDKSPITFAVLEWLAWIPSKLQTHETSWCPMLTSMYTQRNP